MKNDHQPTKSDSGNKRIAKNTAFLYFRMLFVLFVSLYTTRVILHVLGVEDYGVYNVVGGFVSMFGFLNTSLTGAIQRFYNYETSRNGDDGLQKVYITSLLIQGLISIIILLLLETFGIWYLNNVLVVSPGRLNAAHFLFQCSIFSMIFVIMQVPYSAAVMSFEKMNFYAFVGILDVLLKLAIVLVLPLFSGDKLIIYGFLVFLISIINFILYFVFAKHHFKALKFKWIYYNDMFKSMLSFSGWNILGTFSGMIKGQGLNMLLNAFFGPIVNAARGISYQIMTALQAFTLNIVAAFRPQLVDSYAIANYNRTKNIMFGESKICYCLMCVLIVPLIIELKYILNLWLGNEMPIYTEPFTVIVLVIMTVSTLNTPLTQVVHASGKLKKYMIITSVITCFIIPIAWLCLKHGLSPVSVFVVSFIMTIINQIASLWIVHAFFPFSYKEYFKAVILPCLLITLLLPIVPLIVHNHMNESFTRLICICAVDIILSVLIIYIVVLSSNERKMAGSFINKLIKKK